MLVQLPINSFDTDFADAMSQCFGKQRFHWYDGMTFQAMVGRVGQGSRFVCEFWSDADNWCAGFRMRCEQLPLVIGESLVPQLLQLRHRKTRFLPLPRLRAQFCFFSFCRNAVQSSKFFDLFFAS